MKRLKEEIEGLDEGDLDIIKRKIEKREKEFDARRRRHERRENKIKAIHPEAGNPLRAVLATFNSEKETFSLDGTTWTIERYLDGHGVSVMKEAKKRVFYRFKLDGRIIDCWNIKEHPPAIIVDLVEKLLDSGYFKGRIPVTFERE